MLEYYHLLKENALFKGFDEKTFAEVLEHLNARVKNFQKNKIIRNADMPVAEIGIVLDGLVYLAKIDYNGTRTLLHEVRAGKAFGDSLALIKSTVAPVIVSAALNTTVLFIPISAIMEKNPALGEHQKQLLKNMVTLMAEKTLKLQIKNDILSQKTTRDKLLLYLDYESKLTKSKIVKIHFNREDLADYLSLNASALSRELGKMRDEGLISFNKNTFTLKDSHD